MNHGSVTSVGNDKYEKTWVLTYRKSGRTRHFTTLEAARPAHQRAAARYGTRWMSLRPERLGR